MLKRVDDNTFIDVQEVTTQTYDLQMLKAERDRKRTELNELEELIERLEVM